MSKVASHRKGNGQERATTRTKTEKQSSPFTLEPRAPALTITHDEIMTRAYAFFLARGGTHGDDQADWFRAEAELRREKGLQEADPSRDG